MQNNNEATQNRLRRLVKRIATLSKADLPNEEFFQKFLNCATTACDAQGGVIWMSTASEGESPARLKLVAQVCFESSLPANETDQHGTVQRLLLEVLQSGRPAVIKPGGEGENSSAEGMVNPTPYAYLHLPLFQKNSVVGVLQVWLHPYVPPERYAEFVAFLASLTPYFEQHLQAQQMDRIILHGRLFEGLLRYSTEVAGCLDAVKIARLTVAHGRDLIGCDRCSVLLRNSKGWKLISISGQEVVEQKSALVKAMVAFVEGHVQNEPLFLKKEKLLASSPTTADLNYFEHSRLLSGGIFPMSGSEGEIIGALFCESAAEDGFALLKDRASFSFRMSTMISQHAARTLEAARDYESLPLLSLMRKLHAGKLHFNGSRRNLRLVKLGLGTTAVFALALWPTAVYVSGDCRLIPASRRIVSAETDGRVATVLVSEGSPVTSGQPLTQLDTEALEAALKVATQERLRSQVDADRFQTPQFLDDVSAQLSERKVQLAERREKRLQADIANATLRSPINGVVITREPELRTGEFVSAGSPLIEVADLSDWNLTMEVDEREIGKLETALESGESLDLNFILYSHPAYRLKGKLRDRLQISPVGYPKDRTNVFVVTIRNPEIPPALIPEMRPGLTGRAEIEFGTAPRILTFWRKAVAWFQLRLIG